MAPPPAAVPDQQLVRGLRSPRPRLVVREVGRALARPACVHVVDDPPLLLDLVGAREERRVAAQRIEDQALVGLGEACAKRAAVEEVHVHRAHGHALAGHLDADAERDALVRLHVDREHVRAQTVRLHEERMRRALELHGDRRLAPREPLAGAHVEGRVGPAPVLDPELRRDVRLGRRLGVDAFLLAVAGDHLPSTYPGPYCPRTAASSSVARSTLTFSFRTASASKSIGGSIAVSATSWSRWFWKMSREAPACS